MAEDVSTGGVDGNSNHVEARSQSPRAVVAEPGARSAHQARLLARIHRLLGRAVAVPAARLHLHEGTGTPVQSDEVDLDASRPHIARDDAIASALEELRGAAFARGAELTLRALAVRHRMLPGTRASAARVGAPLRLRMGTLHVIATPIGNLEDVTLRALAALREAELLYAEDTRRTRILLDRHGIRVRPRALHAHNEAERCAEALAALEAGQRVALVSDAGTPGVSDPGARLAAEAAAAGHQVVALPGPSAVLAALVVSGLPATPFTFLGFLPRKGGEREALLASLATRAETLVLFEAPQRLAATLAELARALGPRRACVARELTKLHEEAVRGTLPELAERFRAGTRGEVTLVIAGAAGEAAARRGPQRGAPARARPRAARRRPLPARGRRPAARRDGRAAPRALRARARGAGAGRVKPTSGTWLRTLWYLRRAQLLGQARRALFPASAPRRWSGPAPELALAAPAVAWLPAPAHARADGSRILLLNRELPTPARIDWDFAGHGPLFAYHLHQLDWARDAGLPPEARLAALEDWVARHARGVGWDPGPISLRCFAWLKLLTTPGALPAGASSEGLRASLADQLETLTQRLETHLLGNHYLWNLLALTFAGVALRGPAAEHWLAFAPRLARELDEQILPDGMHCERSPMYQALLLESVLDLANAAAASGRAPAALTAQLRAVGARMLGALALVTHPDGEIALFGDSALGIAQSTPRLVAYAAALGVAPAAPATPGLLRSAGFARLESGPLVALITASRPWPPHQPGHAHCDALSFELSVGGERVVTDTGVYEYAAGERRDRARATRSHATIEIDAQEQAECWAAHRIGGRPDVALASYEPGSFVEAVCAGWPTPEVLHRRRFELANGALEIHDSLEIAAAQVRATLPLAPGLTPRLERGAATLGARRWPLAAHRASADARLARREDALLRRVRPRDGAPRPGRRGPPDLARRLALDSGTPV